MSKVIAVMGESGAGKTTSMRNLDHKTTMYIDCDKKGLSWKGWKQQYNIENKNYLCSDKVGLVANMLDRVNKDMPHIKTVVVDTINGLMVADEMRRMKEKGYDKWIELAAYVWDLVDKALTLRDDLVVIFIAHSQTEREESGYMFTRMKTSGKKLEKICLESKFTTVLLAKCVDGHHVFETHSNNSTAKTPLDAFKQDDIDNDIVKVLKVLEEY